MAPRPVAPARGPWPGLAADTPLLYCDGRQRRRTGSLDRKVRQTGDTDAGPAAGRGDTHYRPEIDGLRAVAVLAVLLYHARFEVAGVALVPGGYLGVDIFFVISGYLITRIILTGLDGGHFSLVGFFLRRIRRIVPALLAMIAGSIVAAWILLLPAEMDEFAGSGLAAILSLANFWFWREDAYLAQESLLKPLLHTWSLGVEEQFYLLLPAFLLVAHRFAPRFLHPALLAPALLSLAAADYMSRAAPDAAFYLLPARDWELLAGSLLAFREARHGREANAAVARFVVPTALVLLLGSMLVFDENTRHPSLVTVIPVAATAALIWFARRGGVGGLLGSRPMVAVGLISYALYLWHFPVFAFARVSMGSEPGTVAKLALAGLAFLPAVASYHLVEKPFRYGRSARRYLLATFAAAVAISAVLLHLRWSDGAPYRLGERPRAIYEELETRRWALLESPEPGLGLISGARTRNCYGRDPREACRFGNGRWVALGDSYVAHYEHALLEELQRRGDGMISFVHGTCLPMTGLWTSDASCPLVNDLRRERIAAFEEPRVFLISGNYQHLFRAKRRTADPLGDGRDRIRIGAKVGAGVARDNFRAYVADILAMGHTVVLIHTIPRPHEDVLRRYFSAPGLSGLHDGGARSDPVFNRRAGEYSWVKKRDDFLALPDHPNLIKVFPRDVMCPSVGGKRRCMIIDGDGPLYHLRGHLSIVGARAIVAEVFRAYDERQAAKRLLAR